MIVFSSEKIPEPGMWLQWNWGDGPGVRGRRTQLFAAWLAWSRFRVLIPVWDQQMSTLTWCIDQALRALGGAPTYLLTDNARTVTMDHVAGIPVRHPEMVALGRHYGCKVETCVPRVHARITGRRRDHLHKLSTRIIRENQTVIIEDLPVRT